MNPHIVDGVGTKYPTELELQSYMENSNGIEEAFQVLVLNAKNYHVMEI